MSVIATTLWGILILTIIGTIIYFAHILITDELFREVSIKFVAILIGIVLIGYAVGHVASKFLVTAAL